MHWLLRRLCGQMLLPPQSCSRASFSARATANTPPTAAAAAGGAPTLHWFLWRLCGQMLLPPQSCSQASFSAHTNANTPATATAAAGRGGAPTLQNLLSRLCSQRRFCALCSRRVACCFSQNAMQSSTLVFSTAGPWAPLSSSFESPFSGCSTPPPSPAMCLGSAGTCDCPVSPGEQPRDARSHTSDREDIEDARESGDSCPDIRSASDTFVMRDAGTSSPAGRACCPRPAIVALQTGALGLSARRGRGVAAPHAPDRHHCSCAALSFRARPSRNHLPCLRPPRAPDCNPSAATRCLPARVFPLPFLPAPARPSLSSRNPRCGNWSHELEFICTRYPKPQNQTDGEQGFERPGSGGGGATGSRGDGMGRCPGAYTMADGSAV